MSVELSKQKLDLDDAVRYIQSQMHELSIQKRILEAGIQAIDKENENILESRSILAGEVRKIMRDLNKNY